ncbi:MAG: single-stranded-DNA-specific exonuclease RecJ [Alphaproteobacteria bacterium]
MNKVADSSFTASNRDWLLKPVDERLLQRMIQLNDLPELAARLLVMRGVTAESAPDFLSPKLKNLLPDPYSLCDMEKAANRIAQAVMKGEKTGIFADYDVDGATAAALLMRFLYSAGLAEVRVYVPDRMTEGYGPNKAAFEQLQREGCIMVVTVDCGITAFEPLAHATAIGLDMVVLDHHQAEPKLPAAIAVVNPNRLDDVAGMNDLAAVGVTFLTIVAVNRVLREAGWYANRPEPDLREWLDLVALGTICDVVPMRGINRAFVQQGLKAMGTLRNTGLAALASLAGVSEPPTSFHAGFLLGPRVNAGGRVGKADIGAKLLSTDDPLLAKDYAAALQQFNDERRFLEKQVLEEAMAMAEEQQLKEKYHCVVVASNGWHQGVIGIVASRLVERYRCPACVVAITDGVGKGSGRSAAGFDLGGAVIKARENGLLLAGGGHYMAAGFSLEEKNIPLFLEFLHEKASGVAADWKILQPLQLDAMVAVSGANATLAQYLEQIGPYGSGNPESLVMIRQAIPFRVQPTTNGGHLRMMLLDPTGGERLKAIAFRADGTKLGDMLLRAGQEKQPLQLAGYLRVDRWNGQISCQFQVEDAARF